MLLFFLSFQFISNFLAIASACNFSAFFQIISSFYMPSFQLLLKSAPSFTPMSSYPPQFPEFSGVSVFLPQMSVFGPRGPLHFPCPQSSSILLTLNQVFPHPCIILLQQKICSPCPLVRFSHLSSLFCCKYYFFLLVHYQPFSR